jgi:hypothetical protein
VVDIDGLASGAHALRIEGPAASTVTIWSVEGHTGAGVRVSNFGRGGCDLSHLVLDDTDNAYGMGLHIDSAAADLSILMLGLNDRDISSSLFVSQSSTAIERIVAAGGDVLLVSPGQPEYGAVGIGSQSLEPRAADLYGLADTYDLPLLDLTWVRTDYATADALGLYADSIHSNDTGLEHHARFIYNTLTGA